MHTLKWLFPQGKATFRGFQKVYVYSENALGVKFQQVLTEISDEVGALKALGFTCCGKTSFRLQEVSGHGFKVRPERSRRVPQMQQK
jgi:hypothetical protein